MKKLLMTLIAVFAVTTNIVFAEECVYRRNYPRAVHDVGENSVNVISHSVEVYRFEKDEFPKNISLVPYIMRESYKAEINGYEYERADIYLFEDELDLWTFVKISAKEPVYESPIAAEILDNRASWRGKGFYNNNLYDRFIIHKEEN